jgi:hypothetical protein
MYFPASVSKIDLDLLQARRVTGHVDRERIEDHGELDLARFHEIADRVSGVARDHAEVEPLLAQLDLVLRDRNANIAVFTIDPPVAVHSLEVVEERARALAGAEETHASLVEREVEEAQHLLLRGRLQVDQHVAAADEVHARERRVLDHVVRGGDHHLTNVGDDLIAREAISIDPRWTSVAKIFTCRLPCFAEASASRMARE